MAHESVVVFISGKCIIIKASLYSSRIPEPEEASMGTIQE